LNAGEQRKRAEADLAAAAAARDGDGKTVLSNDIKLANPIALVGSLKGAPRDVDDETFYINCSFDVTLFNARSNEVYVSSNGLFTLKKRATDFNYEPFPHRVGLLGGLFGGGFPDYVLAPFWADLYIYKGTPQGVYYEETGVKPKRKLEVEWYVSRYHSPSQYYHFSLVVEEAKPNIATFKYFEALDKGGKCTIGVQGPHSEKMFSYNEEKVFPGTQVTFDTAKNTFTTSTFKIPETVKPAVKGSVVKDVKPANLVSATVNEIVHT